MGLIDAYKYFPHKNIELAIELWFELNPSHFL